jgi:hypothetical protein
MFSLSSVNSEYPDGWGVYAIHGVRVPAKYVTTAADQIDAAEILQERNGDVRMAVIRKGSFSRTAGRFSTSPDTHPGQ